MNVMRGQRVPDFTVAGIDGTPVRYVDVWQRRNLLLVVLPPGSSPESDRYAAQLASRTPELTAHDTVCLVTRESVPAVAPPAVVVADRWGEIHFAARTSGVDELPGPDELLDWLRYVQMQCPECQGETR
jgi:hypothetical protein